MNYQNTARGSASSDQLSEDGCYVALTNDHLSVEDTMARVRSPEAGAVVVFVGDFDGKPVKELQYSAYKPLALRTMLEISQAIKTKHGLKGIAMVHRLGVVPIGEDSIVIAVSSPHRKEAWLAGEEALEECKARVEVWKREEFAAGEGVWRANRDGAAGQRVDPGKEPGGND